MNHYTADDFATILASRSWRGRENLNGNERSKLEKDGLQILGEIDDLATLPFEQIPKDDIERLKWAGIYAQRPKDGHFLVRVKLPSGRLSAAQAKVIAGISHDYGRDSIQITIRQCIQVHNLTLPDVHDIFSRLSAVGLTSVEGCGDVPRNILGSPLMGIDPDERLDTEPLVDALVETFVGNPAYSNLPRKFKISISSNPGDCGFAGINDLAFTPAVLDTDEGEVDGFAVHVGGGLSADPRLAKRLSFFVRPGEVVPVAEAVATIFREDGPREKRNHVRLKFLVEDWGQERFERRIEELTGPLTRGGRDLTAPWNRGVFHGIHPQRQQGLYYAGVSIPAGSMSAGDLEAFALLSEKYGDGTLRTTNSQNLLLLNIPKDRLAELREEPLLQRFPLDPGPIVGHCSACTGNAYCNFAPVETKRRIEEVAGALQAQFPELDLPLRINLTGCVHSCAHPQIADIGLTGGRARTAEGPVDAFTLQVGGSLGEEARFGDILRGRIPEQNLLPALSEMIRLYLKGRQDGEVFYAFERRVGAAPFQEIADRYSI